MTEVANALLDKWKAFALTLCVGVVPFFVAPSEATENRIDIDTDSTVIAPRIEKTDSTAVAAKKEKTDSTAVAQTKEKTDSTTVAQTKEKTRWIDDYPKQIGLTCSADANIVANYIWRGQYVGGLSLQASARVNYEGLFADMWWNVGATDWVFSGFNPEVDIAVGFDRWGLQLYWLHMHYFDGTPFFRYANAAPGQAGNTSELRARYTVSSKIPLSILWCTRLAGRDGYIDKEGKLQRAWSSYLEIKYTAALPYQMGLSLAVGMTPWRSLYTGFEGNFSVVNIDLALNKQWQVKQCTMNLGGEVMFNPWRVNKEYIFWDVRHPGQQRLNANLTLGIAWQYKKNNQSNSL